MALTVSNDPAPTFANPVAYGYRGRPSIVFHPFDRLEEPDLVYIALDLVQEHATEDAACIVVISDDTLHVVRCGERQRAMN